MPAHVVADVLAYQDALDEIVSTAAIVGYAVGITAASGLDNGWDE